MPKLARHRGPVMLTVMALVLVSIGAFLGQRYSDAQPYVAAAEGAGIDRYVSAFAIGMGPNIDGIALIDRLNETICLYQYQPRRGPSGELVLLAVRSYRYDRMLQEYNTADPSPATVREWLLRGEKLRQERTETQAPPAGVPKIADPPAEK